MRFSAFGKFKREADARGIQYKVEKKRGIPAVAERYRRRYGIVVGVILAVALVFLSHMFVWDVEVTGNKTLTSSEVRSMLKSHGFGVGSYIANANTDRIENKILIDSDKISWISINIVGTVAEVQIRELEAAAPKDTATKPANLVAAKAGVVEEVRIYRGNVVVGAGKYVERGDLLVSGLFDSERVGFRYTRAAGEVMARTTTEYYVKIPYEYEEKRYTGQEYCNKYLTFFDYSINISKKSGKEGSFYDKIYTMENYSFPDGTPTPFSLITEKYLEYETVQSTRTPKQAEELAYFELSQKLGAAAENCVIVKKTVTPMQMKDGFALYCTVVAIENIARVSEFDVDFSE
jgi:similar to stage IV sporulation protein